jgi:hypothetical protein
LAQQATVHGVVDQAEVQHPTASTSPGAVVWVTPGEGWRLVLRPSTLRRTLRIALLVGIILSLVNQGTVVAGGDATAVTWARVAANFFVPFCVSSAGFLAATRGRGA